VAVASQKVGVLGASCLVGRCAVSSLIQSDTKVDAFSRTPQSRPQASGVVWRGLDALPAPRNGAISHWLCFAPIWALPEHFAMLQAYGARRVVAISSTSRFTKYAGSEATDAAENALAKQLEEGEERFKAWATAQGVEWVILRPTLIYGLGQDKNLSEIARFIRRFGFFPLLGEAKGLRQPIHVEDVAGASIAALNSAAAAGREYNIAGGETLTYKEMVTRVFLAVNRQPRFIAFPLMVFRLGVGVMRIFPRYKHWSPAMAERMNRDLVFDQANAVRDFGFIPRPFTQICDN